MGDERSGAMRDEMTSEALLGAWVRVRDEAAFEALFRRHYARVYAVLYRLVGDEADDLAQAAFLRLHDRPPRDDSADCAAWLYRVATRLGYNALRGRRRWEGYRDRLGAEGAGGAWEPAEADPQQAVERDEAGRTVRAALARLNGRQAGLLVLRYSGLSYAEIAQALGLRAGSVGTLLARAEAAFARSYERLIAAEKGAGP
ncbi:MAG: sigma-70 family RNA polymerase sigma factor [Chloroflexota bacterium]